MPSETESGCFRTRTDDPILVQCAYRFLWQVRPDGFSPRRWLEHTYLIHQIPVTQPTVFGHILSFAVALQLSPVPI